VKVTPLLFDQDANLSVKGRLHYVINRAYFNSYLNELAANVVVDMVYLHSDYIVSNSVDDIPYRFLLEELSIRGKKEYVYHVTLQELMLFRETEEWKTIMRAAWKRKFSREPVRGEIERYLKPESSQAAITQISNSLVFIQQVQNQEVVMRDKYIAEQAGAQGPGAKAEGNTFVNIDGRGDQLDLTHLVEELAVLRKYLRDTSDGPEADIEIGSLASAEIAAKEGDSATVLKALKMVGQKALKTASQLGLGVAANAISAALGIGVTGLG
jgi:hypothetical protein